MAQPLTYKSLECVVLYLCKYNRIQYFTATFKFTISTATPIMAVRKKTRLNSQSYNHQAVYASPKSFYIHYEFGSTLYRRVANILPCLTLISSQAAEFYTSKGSKQIHMVEGDFKRRIQENNQQAVYVSPKLLYIHY